MSSIVVQSQWMVEDCVGIPSNFYLFNVIDRDAYDPTLYNETWPSFFHMAVQSFPLYWCGLIQDKVQPNECCRNSMDISQSMYYSAIFGYLDESGIEKFVPKSDINTNYCHVKALTNESLSGYLEIYVRENTCENHIRCNQNNFELYESKDCSGSVLETHPTSNSESNHYNTILGDIGVQTYKLHQSTSNLKWTCYLPGGSLTPDLKSFSGITEVVLVVIIIVGDFILIFNSLKELFKLWSLEKLLALLTQLLFLIYIILQVKYDFTIYDTLPAYYQMFLTNAIGSISYSIGSLFLAMIPIELMVKVFGYQKWRLLIFGILLIVHFIFRGSSYFLYWFMTYDRRYITPLFTFFERFWLPLSPIWTITVILITYLPAFLLMKNVVLKSKGKVQSLQVKFQQFIKKERLMVGIMCLSILNIMVYVTVIIINRGHQLVLQSDRMVLLVKTLPTVNLTIHCLLMLQILRHIKAILSRGKSTAQPKGTKELGMNSELPATVDMKTVKI
ncbi:hypothetical protein HDV02_005468 [Globomyces sp. JEL0801]|nr:hypothetical protein HDV02_005468 [Globomyces sp. JEL0801]